MLGIAPAGEYIMHSNTKYPPIINASAATEAARAATVATRLFVKGLNTKMNTRAIEPFIRKVAGA